MVGRWQWTDVPARLHDRLQANLHGELTGFTSATAGFSPALAGMAELPGERRVFLKGIPRQRHPGLAASLDREIAINLAIATHDPPAPRFLGHWTEDGWTVGAWDAVAGRSPGMPWTEQQLRGVAVTLLQLRGLPPTAVLPAEQVYGDWFGGWARLEALEPGVARATPEDPVESWRRPRRPAHAEPQRPSRRLSTARCHPRPHRRRTRARQRRPRLRHGRLRTTDRLLRGDRLHRHRSRVAGGGRGRRCGLRLVGGAVRRCTSAPAHSWSPTGPPTPSCWNS